MLTTIIIVGGIYCQSIFSILHKLIKGNLNRPVLKRFLLSVWAIH